MSRVRLPNLGRALAAFRRDRRGVSAVEFALVAPVLILIYFGLVELSQGLLAKRRVSHVASAVGDLVAMSDHDIPNSEMTDILSVGSTVMAPFPATGLKLRVTSVTTDAQKVAKVDWSDGQGMAAYTQGQTISNLPAGLLTVAGENLLITEAQYTYTPMMGYVIKNGVNFDEKFYLKPRIMAKVGRTS
jgi:Flp pilus assembly protein TadG